MRLRIAWTLLAAVSLSAAQDRVRARFTIWDDLAPLHARLAARGLTSETFTAYTERLRDENATRVRTGDLDHLVFYALQSTHFTALPAIEPALSAKAFVENGGRIPPDVRPRLAALLKALDSSSRDPRLVYFRALVSASFPERATREAALLREYERVMRFLYDKEFVAQKAGPDAVAELYRARGLSTDTAIEAGYVVYNGLGVLKSLEPDRRIRRVLIIGPGLDLAPRTSFVEAGPPESYQPWAVIDALVSLGLSRLDDLAVVGADINPRVVDHLRRSRDAAPSLTLVSGIAETSALKLSQDYREYFAQLGRSIGDVKDSTAPRGLEGRLAKTVRVRPAAARALEAEPLDIVTERLDGAPFDLVIATNILPYFDDTQLLLAMSNIGAMLAPGGIFLHNEPRPLLGEITAALGFPFEQSRRVVIATASGGAAPLVDSLFTHRRTASAPRASDLGFSFTNIAQQAGLTARTITANFDLSGPHHPHGNGRHRRRAAAVGCPDDGAGRSDAARGTDVADGADLGVCGPGGAAGVDRRLRTDGLHDQPPARRVWNPAGDRRDAGRAASMVLSRGAVLAAIGIGLGGLGAIGLTRFIASMLYQVPPYRSRGDRWRLRGDFRRGTDPLLGAGPNGGARGSDRGAESLVEVEMKNFACLGITTLAVWHASDHYGQLVVYLRMNGIVPPASQTVRSR